MVHHPPARGGWKGHLNVFASSYRESRALYCGTEQNSPNSWWWHQCHVSARRVFLHIPSCNEGTSGLFSVCILPITLYWNYPFVMLLKNLSQGFQYHPIDPTPPFTQTLLSLPHPICWRDCCMIHFGCLFITLISHLSCTAPTVQLTGIYAKIPTPLCTSRQTPGWKTISPPKKYIHFLPLNIDFCSKSHVLGSQNGQDPDLGILMVWYIMFLEGYKRPLFYYQWCSVATFHLAELGGSRLQTCNKFSYRKIHLCPFPTLIDWSICLPVCGFQLCELPETLVSCKLKGKFSLQLSTHLLRKANGVWLLLVCALSQYPATF